MKRSPIQRRTPLKGASRLKPRSRKRIEETDKRRQVREDALRAAGWRCTATATVPEVRCWGPLDVDEVKSRGVNPGGHLDPSNVQVLCRAHHDWRGAHPAEARARGLRKASWDA